MTTLRIELFMELSAKVGQRPKASRTVFVMEPVTLTRTHPDLAK